jgi:heavy metal translocating P-type ATPase
MTDLIAPVPETRDWTLGGLVSRETVLVALALCGLAAGAACRWSGLHDAGQAVWFIATLPVLAALLVEIVQALRRANLGLDVIAALSMSAALTFGEPLAANVVALMYAGGQLLEKYAEGRARREMTALLGRVARTALRKGAAGLEETPIGDLVPGDVVLIRKGEVLPVDGHIAVGFAATLDTSALTGESVPRTFSAGAEALSGSTSLTSAFELIASRPAAESTYAGIVRLVEAAQATKSPMTRLADRYAIGFLAVTVMLAAMAWLLSGDPIRALAVLVVATPCPLILAVPVALISGLSRAAKSGVLIKNGGVLEMLSRAKVVLIDKTGTLTHGMARISSIDVAPGFTSDEVLSLAASLDQASQHVLAATLIDAARARGLALAVPSRIEEDPGAGIAGQVSGRSVVVGGDKFVRSRVMRDDPGALDQRGRTGVSIAVAVDGALAGIIRLEDAIRDDASQVLSDLRRAGIDKIILASGDEPMAAGRVGAALGVDQVLSELDPGEKATLVGTMRRHGPIMMIGDGVNDAPALAAADVGVAMGARGSAASSEAADVVILVDELAPVARAVEIAGRTRGIALQSVWVGLGLSAAAMVVAALGYLPPVQGALLQEAIDVAVILNALRALR